ncbi:MAG: hypothetical protein IK102_01260 [Treponema sp.]|nr:hypothetical protein [Treponema sp.]
MKKCRFTIGFVIILLWCSMPVLAQSASVKRSAAAANRKTAERCLSLSENFMLNSDWSNALSQAELGLSYDDSISDLMYVKAVALSSLGYAKADVIKVIEEAFTHDNWINYSKNSARILYADMLCDTGLYDQSLAVLDSEPLLYSADSEFIRIKNYYRLGTADSIRQARARLNSSRKIYPKDSRFPNLFFMFEADFMNYAERTGSPYEIDALVQTIADYYISTIPNYSDASVENEILALLFCQGEQQKRLLKAVGEKNQNHPMFAYAGLKTGILSQEKAYNLFFESSAGVYSLDLLESFALLITDEDLCQNLHDRLNSLDGTVYIDNDLDLQNELVVTYERGRASEIKYDRNNDGVMELYCLCDFGSPVSISFADSKYDLTYESFPYVNRIIDNSNGSVFHFLNTEYAFNPFEMIASNIFKRQGVDFFVPLIDSEIEFPDAHILADKASSLELATKERNGSRVVYTVFEGRPVFAVFMCDGKRYAYASIEPGYPFIRYVDYDNDEVFETFETYDVDFENKYTEQKDIELIKNIFGENTFTERLYLRKTEIDRNSDTYMEFSEQYLGNNGKVSSWDSDGNGVIDYQYIRYPDSEEGKLCEETIIYSSNGLEYVSLRSEDGIPMSLKYEGSEKEIIKGKHENYFWIEQKGTEQQETVIYENIKNGIDDSTVRLVRFDDLTRLSVIKIGNAYFCRILPPSEIHDAEDAEK